MTDGPQTVDNSRALYTVLQDQRSHDLGTRKVVVSGTKRRTGNPHSRTVIGSPARHLVLVLSTKHSRRVWQLSVRSLGIDDWSTYCTVLRDARLATYSDDCRNLRHKPIQMNNKLNHISL